MLSFDEATDIVGGMLDARLIAIDGLPCAGKSTLAERLKDAFGLEAIYLDDFVLPRAEWASRIPAFPFPYIRYDDFLGAVTTLAAAGVCSYYPFDWETFQTGTTLRTVRIDRPVIIEGVSAINPALASLYSLKLYVESDYHSVLETACMRGGDQWQREWRNDWREVFLPSVDLYLETRPQGRADYVIAGRGAAADPG